MGQDIAHPSCPAHAAVEPGVSGLIVHLALLSVREHLVGLVDLLKRVASDFGVPWLRSGWCLSASRLYTPSGCRLPRDVASAAQNLIVATFLRHSSTG